MCFLPSPTRGEGAVVPHVSLLGQAGRRDSLAQHCRGLQSQQGDVVRTVRIVVRLVDELGCDLDDLGSWAVSVKTIKVVVT